MLLNLTKPKVSDFLTESGAVLLAESIRRYWEDRGCNPPQMWIEPFYGVKGLTSGGREGRSYIPGRTFGLRSDMLNGWPQTRVQNRASGNPLES